MIIIVITPIDNTTNITTTNHNIFKLFKPKIKCKQKLSVRLVFFCLYFHHKEAVKPFKSAHFCSISGQVKPFRLDLYYLIIIISFLNWTDYQNNNIYII